MKIDLRNMTLAPAVKRNDVALFSESNGRILVTVKERMTEQFEQIMDGAIVAKLGEVTSSNLFKVTGLQGNVVITLSLDEMKAAWKNTMSKMQ